MADLRGGDAAANAVIVRDVLSGAKGPKRDVVLLNAAFALMAAGRCATPQEGIAMAANAIDSGAAKAQLDKLVELTTQL